MTFLPASRTVFVVILLASLGLKTPSLLNRAAAITAGFPPTIDAVLEKHGFQVSRFAPDNDLSWIYGQAGSCHVQVASVAPQGWHRSLIAQMAAGRRLTYLFDGTIYSEQPVMRTRLRYYWGRLYEYFGLSPGMPAVLAVIAGQDCEYVPFQDLADLSGGE